MTATISRTDSGEWLLVVEWEQGGERTVRGDYPAIAQALTYAMSLTEEELATG